MIALLSNQVDKQIIASEISYEEELNLVDALIAHKPQAFKYLYRKYAPNLLGIILKIVKQQETAEDLLQETFIKIKQNVAYYDPNKARLFTWLLNIGRNTAIDHLRKKTTRQSKHNQELETVEVFHLAAIPYNTDSIGLQAWVRQLPERQRTLIEMMYFEGYTQTEISDNLQIPLGTVKTQLRSAIMALRKIYQVQYA